MHIKYDRHAKRRMKEREVTEDEVEAVIGKPDYSEPSVKGRTNAFKFLNGRYLRVTYKGDLIITATIRKNPFVRSSHED
ncbi:MAG: DUF4258 domain-containing protein [Dissulfurispiraceae bacterium]